MKKIMVIGGDKRNYYLTKELIENGENAYWYAGERYTDDNKLFISKENCFKDIVKFDIIVLPLPFTKDGTSVNIPFSEEKISINDLIEKLKGKIVFSSDYFIENSVSYFLADSVIRANARLTAIGLLKELLFNTDFDVKGKNALVTGYGNVGKAVTKVLNDNLINVTVCARNINQRIQAEASGNKSCDIETGKNIINEYDFVINTVPFQLFSSENVIKKGNGVYFFELANGLPENACADVGTFVSCKGMPGKHTPQSAGRIIANYILSSISQRGEI